ncbi:MAG: hypothetical protein JNL39_14105 [Opitutaceae bacterium]|nr:hypothetical protein [Opitutaceae bacterium]
MKLPALIAGLLLSASTLAADDDFFDRLQELLTVSAGEGRVRARASGTLDLEGYDLLQPATGLIQTAGRRLFVPRATTFLDAQFGPRVYAFAQLRVDRGFDPGRRPIEARLDEYAVRVRPWNSRYLNLQVGRFGTIVGNWVNRHGSWTDPFITAPGPYENLTGVWDTEAVRSTGLLLRWSHLRGGPYSPEQVAAEKAVRLPIVWGPAYATGAAVSGDIGRIRYAAEIKLGSLSSSPEAWLHAREHRHHPSVSGRLAWRPSQMWELGASVSEGSYLRESADATLAPGFTRGDYRQRVVAQDIVFAWRHLQVWTEIFAARFEIPTVGNADTIAYYAEAKYKFTPQLSGALRWNQQIHGTLPERGLERTWGKDTWRVDLAPAFRFTPHTQLKLQYSLQHGDAGTRTYTRTLATQFTVRY